MSDLDSVRLKMECQLVGRRKGWGRHSQVVTVRLACVAGGSDSPENAAFFAATPSGSASFDTVNETALAFFEPGKEYIITITPAKGEGEG